MFRVGDQLRTDDVVKYVRRNAGKQFYPDTIIRYMRGLRREGKINYTCMIKQDRIIRVIHLNDPHSR